jgi:hypothetical protein
MLRLKGAAKAQSTAVGRALARQIVILTRG